MTAGPNPTWDGWGRAERRVDTLSDIAAEVRRDRWTAPPRTEPEIWLEPTAEPSTPLAETVGATIADFLEEAQRGRVLDSGGRPVPDTLVEIWQANSAGRYPHRADQHDAPTDPNFTRAGRALTDKDGNYRFVTIKPGEYPWRNHPNAWRPAHIHFSLFGPAFVTRVVTQMYFPGDPLLPYDPMFNCVPDEKARNRLISALDLGTTIPEIALGYRFDIVLRGPEETPTEKGK